MSAKQLKSYVRRLVAVVCILGACAFSPLQAQDSQREHYPYVGQVTGDSVRLRGGPSTQYHTIKVLSKDDNLVVVSSKDGWVEVLLPDGAECWISEKFVENKGNGQGLVTGNNVNLRSSADTKNYPIGQASKETVTLKLDAEGNTITNNGYIQLVPPHGARAWISADFVKPADVSLEAFNKALEAMSYSFDESLAKDESENDDPVDEKQPNVDQAGQSDGATASAVTLSEERAAFKELDNLFLEELAKSSEERDLTKIAELYQQYASFAQDDLIREKATDRIRLLKRTDEKIRAVIEKAEEKAQQAADTLRKQDNERKGVVESILNTEEDGPVAYVAIGKVASHGKNAKTPATHALVDDTGDVLYYLRWDKGDLGLYLSKHIGMTGSTKNYEGWDKPVIIVEALEEIPMATPASETVSR